MDMVAVEKLIESAEVVGFTQNTVAKHLGISAGYWYDIRRGRKPLTADVLVKVERLRKKLRAFSMAS